MTAGIPNTVFVTAFAGAAALSFGLTPVVRRAALAFGVLDVPDERKVHTAPVPRLGGAAVGLAMALAVLAALAASPALRSALFGSNGLIRWAALGIALAAVLVAGAVGQAAHQRSFVASRRWYYSLAHHHKARCVAVVVLDIFCQGIQFVELGGGSTGNSGELRMLHRVPIAELASPAPVAFSPARRVALNLNAMPPGPRGVHSWPVHKHPHVID